MPVVAVLNLIVRLFVNGFTDGPKEITAFYEHYSIFVYILDYSLWFFLCLGGILPGTGRYRKSLAEESGS